MDGGFEECKVKVYPKLQVSKDLAGVFGTPAGWDIDKISDAESDLFSGESVAREFEVSEDAIFGDPENTVV